jgi:hypothetical protein
MSSSTPPSTTTSASGSAINLVAATIDTNDIDGVNPRFTIDSIGRPIVTSTTLLGDLRLDIRWWVTPW